MKNLLLGSAAAVIAVSGAQAADLPVKAKPVEYVKVCSLYGAGFWYVPGTDTCLKIGSYVRVQTNWNAEGGGIPLGADDAGSETAGRQTRTDTSNLAFRVRASISVDLRTQTEYGTLRSYLEIGQQLTTNNNAAADSPFFDRGFIQFAGFTAGKIRSFFDINSLTPYTYSNNRVNGDTGSNGIYAIAYTAEFGNGFEATISLEDGGSGGNGNSVGSAGSRGKMVQNLNGVSQVAALAMSTGAETFDNKGWTVPDVVGSLRISQAWGYAEVAAALHDASGGYYTGLAPVGGLGNACGVGTATLGGANCINNGHPGDAYGWAITGGFTLQDVLGLKGDQFGIQAAYSQGAAGYVTRVNGPWISYSGNAAGMAVTNDGVYINGSGVELTTVWGINGFFQHFWNPRWRTSLWGGYVENDFDGTAQSFYCPGGSAANPAAGAVGGITVVGTGGTCNPNSSWWQVGSRTQWNPHPDLDIGLEVVWTHLNTAFAGTTINTAAGAQPPGAGPMSDQDIVSAYFRLQRNFLP